MKSRTFGDRRSIAGRKASWATVANSSARSITQCEGSLSRAAVSRRLWFDDAFVDGECRAIAHRHHEIA